MATQLVLDCDPGHDDAMALLLAVAEEPKVPEATITAGLLVDVLTKNEAPV